MISWDINLCHNHRQSHQVTKKSNISTSKINKCTFIRGACLFMVYESTTMKCKSIVHDNTCCPWLALSGGSHGLGPQVPYDYRGLMLSQNLAANGSAAFIWKLHCHWLQGVTSRGATYLDGVFADTQGVPQLDGLVPGTGHDLAVVSGESHAQHILGVTYKLASGVTTAQ